MQGHFQNDSQRAKIIYQEAMNQTASIRERVDEIAFYNQKKVLDAFRDSGVQNAHMLGSTGYGYTDIGRDKLEEVFSKAFCGEDALVRPNIASGTHAIYLVLRGLLLPGDTLYYISGRPYDTLHPAIGLVETPGSLMQYGIHYKEQPLLDGEHLDVEEIVKSVREDSSIKVVAIQRSAGYSLRNPIPLDEMRRVFSAIRSIRHDIMLFVDNCYGEFTAMQEPLELGADVIAGSLIKNAGGGLAPSGGYIVGSKAAIKRIEAGLSAPGIGREVGSYEPGYRLYFQGLFLAPSVAAAAVKTALLFSAAFEQLGFEAKPSSTEMREDIIQAIVFHSPAMLCEFCRAIQYSGPVDAMAVPEPDLLAGYEDQVIMAAATFVSGASIELSADGPMRSPYIGFFQGGLTFEHGKVACFEAIERIMKQLK